MQLKLYVQMEVRDAQGRLVRRYRRHLGRSLVLQYLQHFKTQLSHVAVATNKDTGGTNRTIDTPPNVGTGYLLSTVDVGGEASRGIVVGSGSNAEAMTDYALQTQIAHGTGSGQLSHGAETFGPTSESATQASFTFQRVFTNNSGASINVRETAIYGETDLSGAGTAYFCIVREVESGNVAVGALQTLTVTFTFTITT